MHSREREIAKNQIERKNKELLSIQTKASFSAEIRDGG